MRPITATVGPLIAASANNIATAQSLAGPGAANLVLVGGGTVVLDKARRVAIASAGNDSGVIWTLTGTSASGNIQSETFAGGNIATVVSALDYATVTSIRGSGATGSVTAGTAAGGANPLAMACSPWVRLDEWADAQVGVQVAVTGTVTFTVQTSFDEGPDSLVNPIPASLMAWDTSTGIGVPAAGGSATISFSIPTAPLWIRVALNTATGTGSVRMNVVQYNDVAA